MNVGGQQEEILGHVPLAAAGLKDLYKSTSGSASSSVDFRERKKSTA